jgi:acetyltransferase
MNLKKLKKINYIFDPKSIAVVGASDKELTVGNGLIKNLESEGKRKLFYVNPNDNEVLGRETYKKITDIKSKIDLVIIIVHASLIPDIVKECCTKKVGSILVISNGFSEAGEEGKKLEEEIVALTVKADIPLVGPNCLGIINTWADLNASFSPVNPPKGNIALLSQSGSMVDAILDISAEENFGFSKIVSYGNEADLTLEDFLHYLKSDRETKVIALYFEAIKNGKEFMETVKEVSRYKPIVAIKAGKGTKGKKAATTHTGALSTDYEIYKTALKQSGAIQVDTLEEMLDAIEVLSFQPRCENNIAIITNGGGLGVLATDYCEEMGINLPELREKTVQSMEKEESMEKVATKRNPLDIIGDAVSARYEAGIRSLLEQEDIAGLLIMQSMQIMTEPLENAKIIVELNKKFPEKTMVCCFAGKKLVAEAIEYLEKNKIPNYADPYRAVKALNNLIKRK